MSSADPSSEIDLSDSSSIFEYWNSGFSGWIDQAYNIPASSVPTYMYMVRAFDFISAEVKNLAYSDLENAKLLKRPVKDKKNKYCIAYFYKTLGFRICRNLIQ